MGSATDQSPAIRSLLIVLGVLTLVTSPAASSGANLDERLKFLAPLIGPDWEGGYAGKETDDLVISLRFESILEGKAVKYSRAAAAVGFSSETFFYWSPSQEEVLYLSLNSRGIVGEGVVTVQDGEIVLLGVSHWPERSVESRTVLQIDAAGVLTDTFTRKEDGNWIFGHLQEFHAGAGE